MADSDDLELGSEDDPAGTAHATHPVRKRIAIKLRHGGKGRVTGGSSGRKAKVKSTKDSMSERDHAGHDNDDVIHFGDDVDKTMQFASVKIGGTAGEPFHKNQKLKWDHKVNLLGQKVVDPLIHSCEKCSLPILIYGRMIPCKHVFCYSCAKTTDKSCPRCSQSVVRIEQAALGTVFVCTFGGTKHGVSGCHRTYLSQRDLQAHVAHRHYGAGREPAVQRVVPPEMLPAPGTVRPTGAGAMLAYSVNQPMPAIIGDGSNLVFRPQQPTAPSGPAMPPIVVSHPPPGIPQQQLPPPPHILTQHGPHVIGTNPGNLPPRILPTSHASGMPPPLSASGMANPPAVLVQTVPVGAPSAVRPTNLITIKMPDEASEYHHSADTASSAGRPPFTSQPPPTHENALSHFTAQRFPPHGPPPVSFKQEHHQMSVRPMMTHPGAPPAPSSQLSHPPGMVGMPPGQMGPLSAPPQRLGPSPQSIHSGPPQNMAPPPQAIRSGPPQAMHSGPPAMHTGPPPQGLHTGPPPQGMHSGPPPSMHSGPPPQGLHSGPPPPQGLRSAPPPGFPPQARHPPDQHVQLWQSGGPTGGQVQRIATPPGSRPSPAPSQSMPFYQ